jgi:RNA polymerase sigma-70 factor (ECF subfamily)
VVAERARRIDDSAAVRDHLGELCLAWACLAGDPAAQRAIDGLIQTEARRAVTELRQPAHLADEVHQELGQRLLVAAPGGSEPRLATYAGQSALGRWLGVAAMRVAINLRRRERPQVALDEVADVAAAIVPPDLAAIRDRYRDDVAAAVRAAFEALDSPRDRNLLRLHYLERIALDRLGAMFGVHASTVSRWLSALRETIVEDARNRLAERLGLANHVADLDSVIRLLRSELDLTLSRILSVQGSG